MINTIVIDTETMDTRPSALILSIGAIAFDIADLAGTQESILHVSREPDLNIYFEHAFYGLVSAYDQLMLCRTVSRDTQMFWREQAEVAKEALEGENLALGEQLERLKSWIGQQGPARVFFRGTDFDGAILESAYRTCKIKCPWHFAGKRDVRTYIDAMTKGRTGYVDGHQPCFMMIPHHALHDAMRDAEQMCIAYARHTPV